MKQKKWIKVLSILILFFFVISGSEEVLGSFTEGVDSEQTISENDSNGKSLKKEIDFEESYKISNVTSYYESFYISDKMHGVNAEIDLSVLMSNTALKDISSITIYANEVPISSYKFIDLVETESIKLNIGEEHFTQGSNTISIRAYVKSSEDDCEKNEEINWALIQKGSRITIHYFLQQIEYISELYEGTYFFENTGGKLVIAVPDKMTEFDYTLAATFSALAGNHFKSSDSDLTIETVPYSSLSTVGHSAIVLGTKAAIKENFKEVAFYGDSDVEIQQVAGISHIFALLDDEQALLKFTKTFSDEKLYGQLLDKKYTFDSEQKETLNDSKFQEKITGFISEIGYEDSMIVGSGRQIFQYYIGLPGKYTKLKENTIKFIYSYSENIDFSDSYITVYINNEPVKTQPLTKEMAQNDSIEFSIPDTLYDYNGFNITVDFNLSKTSPCESKVSNGSWVKVNTQKSTYDFRTEKRDSFSLFTSTHFVQDNEGNINGEILVDRLNYDINHISNFCSYLGKRALDVNLLKIVQSDSVPTNYEGFVIGTFKSSLLQSMADNLEIPFDKSGKVIENELFTQVNETIGVIQITKDYKIAAISGSNKKQLNFALDHYSDKIDRYDAQIVTLDDTILAKYTNEPVKDRQVTELIEEVSFVNLIKNNWMPIIFAVAAMLILVIFAYRVRRKTKPARVKGRIVKTDQKKVAEKNSNPVIEQNDEWDNLLIKDAALNEKIADSICKKYKLNIETAKVSEMTREMLHYENLLWIRETLSDCYLLSRSEEAETLEQYYTNTYEINNARELIRKFCNTNNIDEENSKVSDLTIEQLQELDEQCHNI